MDKKLKRRMDILSGYAVLSLLVFGYLVFTSFANKEQNESMDELTVKRINLVSEDGSLRMVISNETRQHPGIIGGKKILPRKRPAGIIFFDNQGNECGGLVYQINEKGDKVNKFMTFTMDAYHNDQVVQIINSEERENGKNSARRGLVINEYKKGADLAKALDEFRALKKMEDTTLREQKLKELWEHEGSKRRLFIGRTPDQASGLFLYDTAGKPKMKIYVDKAGDPKIELIDDEGNSRYVPLN